MELHGGVEFGEIGGNTSRRVDHPFFNQITGNMCDQFDPRVQKISLHRRRDKEAEEDGQYQRQHQTTERQPTRSSDERKPPSLGNRGTASPSSYRDWSGFGAIVSHKMRLGDATTRSGSVKDR